MIPVCAFFKKTMEHLKCNRYTNDLKIMELCKIC